MLCLVCVPLVHWRQLQVHGTDWRRKRGHTSFRRNHFGLFIVVSASIEPSTARGIRFIEIAVFLSAFQRSHNHFSRFIRKWSAFLVVSTGPFPPTQSTSRPILVSCCWNRTAKYYRRHDRCFLFLSITLLLHIGRMQRQERPVNRDFRISKRLSWNLLAFLGQLGHFCLGKFASVNH